MWKQQNPFARQIADQKQLGQNIREPVKITGAPGIGNPNHFFRDLANFAQQVALAQKLEDASRLPLIAQVRKWE